MTRYVISKVASAVVTVLGACLIAFVLLRLLPGDPARLVVGRLATQAELVTTRDAMGLNQPVPVQFYRYITGFVQGNWGYSYTLGQPVRTLIVTRLPASLELGFYAFVLAFISALVLALLSVRNRLADRIVRGLSFLGLGTPPFWLALLLLLLLSQHFHLFPGPEGRSARGWRHRRR